LYNKGVLKWQNVAEKAAKESNIDWSEYFASIVSVCPWSKSYWRKQTIDIQYWKGINNITPLENYVARMWIHTHASGRLLCKIHNRLNQCRLHEEWLYSHPCYGGHSTPIPVLIQQDLAILTKARTNNSDK
jgi:hypothetical protein